MRIFSPSSEWYEAPELSENEDEDLYFSLVPEFGPEAYGTEETV